MTLEQSKMTARYLDWHVGMDGSIPGDPNYPIHYLAWFVHGGGADHVIVEGSATGSLESLVVDPEVFADFCAADPGFANWHGIAVDVSVGIEDQFGGTVIAEREDDHQIQAFSPLIWARRQEFWHR